MADGGADLFQLWQKQTPLVTKRDVRYASHQLIRARPDWSCSNKVRHRSALVAASVIAGCFGLFQPLLLLGLVNLLGIIVFAVLIALRAWLVMSGAVLRRAAPCENIPEHLTQGGRLVDDALERSQIWPRYSVLVPLYKEAASVPDLVDGLKQLDYPLDRLEVLFLTEMEDKSTFEALQAISLPSHWSVLSLPDGAPRTKPRALNVALAKLLGEVVTIYDAEDRPHPQQLKWAVSALARGGETMACVQAPLRAYNHRSSWIAGQWALEYDVNFGLILPALEKADLPITLGGTSNHFRVQALREAGGWDAWNVTEDADLGLRFARLGYKIGTIDKPTLEEAPERLSVWLPQRSRWIKGYMQSAAVILRRPRAAIRQMGLRGFLASQILLSGAILSACLHGPFALFCLLCLLLPGLALPPACLGVLIAGYAVHAMGAFFAPGKRGRRRVWMIATAPLYWPLQSLAAFRALYELATAPHIWSKTPHALTALNVSEQSFEAHS